MRYYIPEPHYCGTEHQQMGNLGAELNDPDTGDFMAMYFLKVKATFVSVVKSIFYSGFTGVLLLNW